MKIHLAPMEGLTDSIVRDIWTRVGGYDQCTSEFIRVTQTLLPAKVFYRVVPELKSGGKTAAGVPVFVQLLGGDPDLLAENAQQAAALGALGLDLNFGCPAPLVNRHDGGAVILKSPDRIFNIVSKVKTHLPHGFALTAKLRLGFEDTSLCLHNVEAAASAGAEVLTIHCRTKTDMYKPPAFWDWIPKIKDHLNSKNLFPKIISNGEIWTRDDFIKCRTEAPCDGVMLGRGAISNPFLALQIKSDMKSELDSKSNWNSLKLVLLECYQASCTEVSENYAVARTKQNLRYFMRNGTFETEVFHRLKELKGNEFFQTFQSI